MSLPTHRLLHDKSFNTAFDNKDIKSDIHSVALGEVIGHIMHSFSGLWVMHGQAVMAKLVIRGLKPSTPHSALKSRLLIFSHSETWLSVARGWQSPHKQFCDQHLTPVIIPSAPSNSFPSSHGTAFSLKCAWHDGKPVHWMSSMRVGSWRAEQIKRCRGWLDVAAISSSFTEMALTNTTVIYFIQPRRCWNISHPSLKSMQTIMKSFRCSSICV